MTLDALKLGQVVMSTQGRDAGRLFIVVGFAEENHVLICDGALRKIDKPKKKKVKHLNPKQECISSLGKRRQDLRCGDPKGAGSPEGSRIGCALQGG
mgnify:CR=1 FL=1